MTCDPASPRCSAPCQCASWGAAALLLATSTTAQAGALDRTLQPVGVIFEEGNYAELSYGITSPEVSGTVTIPGLGEFGSGNVGMLFSTVTLSFKYDVTDRVALAVVVDQPFGADVDYGDADAGYLIAGSSAEFRSNSVTVLGRYEVNDRFSVHGGARHVTTDADLFVSAGGGAVTYDAEYDQDSDTAFVLGAAYEREEIAWRVALTYSSETDFSNGVAYRAGSAVTPGPERPARSSTPCRSRSRSTSAPASPQTRSSSARSAGPTGPRQ